MAAPVSWPARSWWSHEPNLACQPGGRRTIDLDRDGPGFEYLTIRGDPGKARHGAVVAPATDADPREPLVTPAPHFQAQIAGLGAIEIRLADQSTDCEPFGGIDLDDKHLPLLQDPGFPQIVASSNDTGGSAQQDKEG